MADPPRRPRAGDVAQIDASFPRPPPHRWRRQNLLPRSPRRCRPRALRWPGHLAITPLTPLLRLMRHRIIRRQAFDRRSPRFLIRCRLCRCCRLGFCRSSSAIVLDVARPRDVEANEFSADRQRIPDLTAKPHHRPLNRGRHLDTGLVRHDDRDDVIFPNRVPDRDVPLDDFRLRNALPDVWQLDDIRSHLSPPSLARARGRPAPASENSPTPGHADKAYPNPSHG